MDTKEIRKFIEDEWRFVSDEKGAGGADADKESVIIAALRDFIRLKNDSPDFDKNWPDTGEMYKALDLLVDTVEKLRVQWAAKGCKTDDVSITVLGGRENPKYSGSKILTPLLLVDVPAFGGNAPEGTVLMYGHMDKQPGLDGKWTEGLGPRKPVVNKEGRLYGRGGADDGYAIFSAFSAIMALRRQGVPHARCTILIEACEESGSIGLEDYLTEIKASLGNVTLIVCLDSGCENYEQLWLTTSLRGLANCTLGVQTIRDGVHSGDASGIVPSSYRILNQLIARVENPETGEITPSELKVYIRKDVREQAAKTAEKLGEGVYTKYNFLKDPEVRPVSDDLAELVLNRTWRTQLSVTGISGLPLPDDAGNVMLPQTTAKLSFRLPPTLNSVEAREFLEETLTNNPPYNAHVSFESEGGNGWAAPQLEKWLNIALDQASDEFFGAGYLAMGEGGSIPFMGMLGEMFPKAQFIITGVLGPHSNAHGPDEFLDIPTAQKVTMCVAYCLAKHCEAELAPKTNDALMASSQNTWGSHRCCGHSHTHGSGRCSI